MQINKIRDKSSDPLEAKKKRPPRKYKVKTKGAAVTRKMAT